MDGDGARGPLWTEHSDEYFQVQAVILGQLHEMAVWVPAITT